MIKFPKYFMFGGSSSGPQTEGTLDKPYLNVFNCWSLDKPTDFYNQIDSSITSNMYQTYKDDIKLLKQVGIELYRTSIQWTRLIKNFETNEVDEQAAQFYWCMLKINCELQKHLLPLQLKLLRCIKANKE